MRKGLLIFIFSLFVAGMSFAAIPDSLQLIGEGGEGQNYLLMKENFVISPSSAVKMIYGGDLLKGCSIGDLRALIVKGSASHDSACYKAAKSVDKLAKVAFFPWALYEGGAVAESLGICFIAPVSTGEIFGYGYKPIMSNSDFLLFVPPGQFTAEDTVKKYFPNPPGLSRHSVCVTTGDSLGNLLGACGPTVDFVEHWDLNYRSFVITKEFSIHSYIQRRAMDMWNIDLLWDEVRQICYMLAPEGAIDSLGRRESFRGAVDTTSIKVDNAIHTFQAMKMVAPVYIFDEPSQPRDIFLAQNYPNPFNPTTNIRYELGCATHVQLTIFNYLGQEVEKVVDEFQAPGSHQVVWNAGDAPSGIYYCHLVGEGFSEVRRMTLLK